MRTEARASPIDLRGTQSQSGNLSEGRPTWAALFATGLSPSRSRE
jgi:hypothetical protein